MKFTYKCYLIILLFNENVRLLRWPGEFDIDNFIPWKKSYYRQIKAKCFCVRGAKQ
jgi:hypothetical protein